MCVKQSESAAYECWWDTLDELLVQISPEFETKRMEKLFEKLNKLAQRTENAEEGMGEDVEEEEADDERGEYKES